MFGTEAKLHSLPGCLLVHTTAGVYLLDPISLTPMLCKLPSRSSSSRGEEDPSGMFRPQFDIANCIVAILKVFDVSWRSEKITKVAEELSDFPSTLSDQVTNTPSTHDAVNDDDQSDVSNSCSVAMAINNRLIVMRITAGSVNTC